MKCQEKERPMEGKNEGGEKGVKAGGGGRDEGVKETVMAGWEAGTRGGEGCGGNREGGRGEGGTNCNVVVHV